VLKKEYQRVAEKIKYIPETEEDKTDSLQADPRLRKKTRNGERPQQRKGGPKSNASTKNNRQKNVKSGDGCWKGSSTSKVHTQKKNSKWKRRRGIKLPRRKTAHRKNTPAPLPEGKRKQWGRASPRVVRRRVIEKTKGKTAPNKKTPSDNRIETKKPKRPSLINKNLVGLHDLNMFAKKVFATGKVENHANGRPLARTSKKKPTAPGPRGGRAENTRELVGGWPFTRKNWIWQKAVCCGPERKRIHARSLKGAPVGTGGQKERGRCRGAPVTGGGKGRKLHEGVGKKGPSNRLQGNKGNELTNGKRKMGGTAQCRKKQDPPKYFPRGLKPFGKHSAKKKKKKKRGDFAGGKPQKS